MPRFTNAIARLPASNLADGITAASLGAPDLDLAMEQHQRYVEAIRNCGLRVTLLEADAQHPDSTFVEDTAVIAGPRAVLTRPGAASRMGEVVAMYDPLRGFFDWFDQIEAPGTLDGGDICEADGHFYIGISRRTNSAGAQQLAGFLAKAGYTSTFVDIRGMTGILHLKSGVSYLRDGNFVAVDELIAHMDFRGANVVRVREDEAYGANCVRVNGFVLLAAGNPVLKSDVERLGYPVIVLDMSEFAKMDGGLSCLSLRF